MAAVDAVGSEGGRDLLPLLLSMSPIGPPPPLDVELAAGLAVVRDGTAATVTPDLIPLPTGKGWPATMTRTTTPCRGETPTPSTTGQYPARQEPLTSSC